MSDSETIDKSDASSLVELNEAALEGVLTEVVYEVLRRMGKVRLKEMSEQQAGEMDDALVRHLARALMGENPGFSMALPYVGEALISQLRDAQPTLFDNIAVMDNPRAVMVEICRYFMMDVYHMLKMTAERSDFSREVLDTEVARLTSLWMLRLMGSARH